MKFSTCLFSLVFLVVSAVGKPQSNELEKMKGYLEECKKEHSLTDEDLKDNKFERYDKTRKCFVACLFQKQGVLNKDGKFNLEVPIKMLENNPQIPTDMKNNIMKAFTECPKEIMSDPDDLCETAYNFMVCEEQKYQAVGKA